MQSKTSAGQLNNNSHTTQTVVIAIFVSVLLCSIAIIIGYVIYKSIRKKGETDTYRAVDNSINKKVLSTWNFGMMTEKYFMYNPAVYWIDDDHTQIGVISRISGHTMRPRFMQCTSYMNLEAMKKNKILGIDPIIGLQDYLDIFGERNEGCSGIVQFKMDLLRDNQNVMATVVNPFYSKSNICDDKYLGFEDPRVFMMRRKPYVITYFRGKNFPYDSITNTHKMGHYLCIFPLDMSEDPLLLNYRRMRKVEKNWMPFEYENELYIIYSVEPHKILKVDMHTGKCKRAYETNISTKRHKDSLGNGAPPQKITLGNKEYFLGMAHTRDLGESECTLVRKNFFYLFEGHPPFRITHISRTVDLTPHNPCIEFGSGLLVDQKSNTLYVANGIDDCFSSISSYPLSMVLESFEEV